MRRLPALLLALVPLVVAGCVTTPAALDDARAPPVSGLTREEVEARLSQPVFEAIKHLEATVEGADGVTTWLDVFLPEGATEPVPVILVMTPYRSLGDAFAPFDGCIQACPYDARLVSYFVPRGYAVAFSDVRGNHNSGGCIDQTGPDQWQDGYNVVEWLGTQPWSNGRVGMHGISYDGETQISTALLNPPHLVTIVPVASVSNQYEYMYYDGVPYELQGVTSMGFYAAISAVPGTHPNALTSYHERLSCQPENFEAAADLSGDWSGYWQARDYRVGAENITASVLQVHGLGDWNVKPNHVDGFFDALTTEKRLILGQWAHAYPDREDWQLILHRWYDHWLLGIDTGILADLPPVLVEDSAGQWRALDAWPPRAPSLRTLHLGAEGALSDAPAKEGERVVADHPGDLVDGYVPVSSDAAGYALMGAPSRLVFESEPFAQELRVTGRPTLRLVAQTDALSTHWAVHLVKVTASGEEEIINRGYLDTRHRDGVDAPKDLRPGEEYAVTIRLFPQDDVIEKGARLRVVLANDDDWIHQDGTRATSVVRFGPGLTALHLPQVEGAPVHEDRLRDGL